MNYQLRAAEKNGSEGMINGWHIHPELEVLLVESDNVPCRINEREYTLSTGTLVLFNNLERHSISVPGCGYHRFLLMFRPGYLKEIIAKDPHLLTCFFHRPVPEANILHLTTDEASSVKNKMKDIISIRKAQGEPSVLSADNSLNNIETVSDDSSPSLLLLDSVQQELYLRFALACLLMEINALHKKYYPENAVETDRYSTVSCIIQYVHEHLDDPQLIKLDNLSHEFAMSRTILCNAFKKCTGTALRQYIIDCRIWQAQEYLLAGISVQDTGIRVGYEDIAHFSRVFHQKTGFSPRDWCKHNLVQKGV